jgi:transcriptional regulator with XRE-family HTH domain
LNLSNKIKILREQLNMSQRDLGKKIGLDGKQICRYERQVTNPSIYTLKKLARALGVTIDYLLEEKDDIKNNNEIKDKEILAYCKKIDEMKGNKKKAAKMILQGIIQME